MMDDQTVGLMIFVALLAVGVYAVIRHKAKEKKTTAGTPAMKKPSNPGRPDINDLR